MAWPDDALHTTFAPLVEVASAFLNSIQNAVIDIFEEQQKITVTSVAEHDGTGNLVPAWSADPTTQNGMLCNTASRVLRIYITGTQKIRVRLVQVKVFNSGAATIVGDLYRITGNFGTAASAPTVSGSLATDTAAGAGAWDTLVLTPAAPPEVLTGDQAFCVEITLATAGDLVAGIRINHNPYTFA